MRNTQKKVAAPVETGSRYAELKQMLDDRRRELQAEVQGKMRGVREEGSNIASTGDVIQEKTLYYTKPRALVTWSPDEDTQLRFRLERSVGQLDFTAFVAGMDRAGGRDRRFQLSPAVAGDVPAAGLRRRGRDLRV